MENGVAGEGVSYFKERPAIPRQSAMTPTDVAGTFRAGVNDFGNRGIRRHNAILDDSRQNRLLRPAPERRCQYPPHRPVRPRPWRAACRLHGRHIPPPFRRVVGVVSVSDHSLGTAPGSHSVRQFNAAFGKPAHAGAVGGYAVHYGSVGAAANNGSVDFNAGAVRRPCDFSYAFVIVGVSSRYFRDGGEVENPTNVRAVRVRDIYAVFISVAACGERQALAVRRPLECGH